MPLNEELALPLFHQARILDYALADPENTADPFTVTDTEGDHDAIAATLSLGCGWIGKEGIPWNVCSSTGTDPCDCNEGRRTYAY